MELSAPVKQLLVNSGVTATIKRQKLPDSPTDVVLVRDTGEYDPDIDLTTIQKRTVQVIVRGTNYAAVTDLCNQIRGALHGQIGITVGTTHFLNILALAGFQPIGDELGNYVYSANFTAMVRVA